MTSQPDQDPGDILIDHTAMVARVIAAMRAEAEPLRLNDYAEIAGISPFYFNRIFKSVIGIPPGEFATSLRFERAKHLLLTSPASVTDICFEVGYESLGTFSSRFKKLIGVTPADFRHLPDTVVDLDFGRSTFKVSPHMRHHSCLIQGTMDFPDSQRSSIFVGVFPAALAADRPVVGRMLTEPGPFELPHVPFGTWIVLSAALPQVSDPIGQLLPDQRLRVAASPTFTLSPGAEIARVHLEFRQPNPFEPPVLTALPALLLG